MKRTVKMMCIIFATVLVIGSTQMASFAFEQKSYNISSLTWEDIMTMSNADFRRLLSEFEKEYDPFNTYKTASITESYYNGDGKVQPQWTSGDKNHEETGSHELITARACGILLDDKGFWGTNRNSSIIIALTISLASIIPDKDTSTGAGSAWIGHFYDPDTGKNWGGSSTNTAKTNMINNYNAANHIYIVNGQTEIFYEYVGKMLHYIQDACEPHHAANIVSTGPLSAHYKFETFADENLNSYIDSYKTIPSSSYASALNKSTESIIHEAAVIAKGYAPLVKNVLNQSDWSGVAKNTTQNAVMYSAVILYKLSIQSGIPLCK